MRKLLPLLLIGALSSCASHQKKIIVYASSDIQVDNTQRNIAVREGSTQTEKVLDFSGSGPVELSVNAPQGKLSLKATEDGLYIANLKPDTIVGSLQHVGSDNGNAKISQDELKRIIDSLEALMAGKNVSPSNRNFFILPGGIQKISDQTGAKVFGPYTKIPGIFDASTVPEVYKFYSLKEMREMVEKLPAMTKF